MINTPRCLVPLIVLAAASLLAGCAAGARDDAPIVEPAAPGMLPTPYTAEQIRDANTGQQLVFRVEDDGAPVIVRTIAFVGATPETATIEEHAVTEGGDPVAEPKRYDAAWTDLRDHASFPAERTSWRETTCEVPAGRFQCWLYTVEGEAGDGPPSTSRFYFAHDRPGPPILYEIDSDGGIVFRMELIEDSR